jgi:hypothetical protein
MSRTSVKQSVFGGWVPRAVGLAGVAVAIGLAAGCSSDKPGSVNAICKLNSDCTADLVCSFGLCHAECEKLKDCPANQLCVRVGGDDAGSGSAHVCQLQQESHCAHNSDCNAPLVCAVDLQCRNQCVTTRDCFEGQTCVFGVCANPDEVGSDGKLRNAESGSNAPGSGAGGAGNDGGTGASGGSTGGGGAGGGHGGVSGASSGGAGGSGTTEHDAGTGGSDHDASAGKGGADSGTAPVGSDPCGSTEKKPNDVREDATPYALGTEFKACLQTMNDVDFYQDTVPSTPAQGGVVLVSLTDVGANGGLSATTYAVADNGQLVNSYGLGGQSVFHWFSAKAGASFQVKVNYFTSSQQPTPYTLLVKYTGVDDKNEPNDTRATATPITNGKAVNGYLFAGFEDSTSIPSAAWEDWFKVTLPAGMATISLMDLASDINGQVTLYDSLGSQVANNYSVTAGASVVMNQMVMASDYYVKITPFTAPSGKGTGSTTPAYPTQPYTLTTSVK